MLVSFSDFWNFFQNVLIFLGILNEFRYKILCFSCNSRSEIFFQHFGKILGHAKFNQKVEKN